MNSSKAFDKVIQYLETIVINDSEIDYDEISKITVSHAALFQRIFIFVSGLSISDYVRKRRLTLAAHDLKNNDISVLDIVLKYGFQSHSAFTRAFKEHHGITPTEARLETVQLNDYLPINFLDMRFIGGKRVMAEMKKIIYRESVERLFVGLNRKETTFPEVGKLWQEFFNSDAVEKLKTLSNASCCDDIDANDGIGIVYNFKGTDTFDIIIGDFFQPGTQTPNGLCSKHIPKGMTARIQIEGNNVPEILASAFTLITEAVEKTDRKIDYDNFYWCDVYTHERYSEPMKRGEKVIIDYIIPVLE